MGFNQKVTRKLIHKIWFKYMIDQYAQQHAAKYGEYDPRHHSIRHEGQVVIKDTEGRRIDLLDEVGMDYDTFRMKFNTSGNPTWQADKAVRSTMSQLDLGLSDEVKAVIKAAVIAREEEIARNIRDAEIAEIAKKAKVLKDLVNKLTPSSVRDLISARLEAELETLDGN